MLKINNSPSLNLDKLAATHWSQVDGKTGKKKAILKKNSITYKLTQAAATSTGDEQNLYNYLLSDPNAGVKAIVTGSPSELKTISDNVNRLFPKLEFFTINKKKQIKPTQIGIKMSKIFDYTAFRKSNNCMTLLWSLGYQHAAPCPYCNLDEISVVKIHPKGSKAKLLKALLDLDHFFPKYKFPFLGLSFYNLVPSCHNCNSLYKGYKDFRLETHIQPYLTDFDDNFKFQLAKPFDLSQTAEDLIYECKSKTGFKDNSVIDLGLLSRYDSHRHLFLGLLQKMYKEYKRVPAINQLFGNPVKAKDIFELAHVPIAKKDIVLYSMGKLKRDILMDLGVF